MNYISVSECAKKWGVSARSVRNYCAGGRIEGAFLTGKTWNIPRDAEKPVRKARAQKNRTLLEILRLEKNGKISGGLYHKIQIDMTYNSNHIEGSALSHEQTRYIFETSTVGAENTAIKIDDIIETVNHFRCIDYVLDNAKKPLTETYIKTLHRMLKRQTSDAQKKIFAVGAYKKLPNEVGGVETSTPENVARDIAALVGEYNEKSAKTFEDIVDFHARFEKIHPFQDGNGRVGRLVMFGECLKNNFTPFIITDELKFYYYRGLREWSRERGYLLGTCLTAQDEFKVTLDYFRIPHE